MSPNLKISIITISYNAAETIEKTITSVTAQDYSNIEYIIQDGGSSDSTLDIVKKYQSKIAKVNSEKDNGLYDAINKAIDCCTGDIIGLIHADDFYIDNHVIAKVAQLFNKTKADAVYADLYYVERENTDVIKRKWKSGIYSDGMFLNGWMPPHPTFFVRKDVYQKHGKFNLQLKSAADYELMLRFIHKHKIKLAYLPEYIVKMRVGGLSNQSVNNRVKANNEDRKAWELNGLKPRFYTLYLKPLRKIAQFWV